MDIELGYVPRDAAASAALRERLIDGLRGFAEASLNSRLSDARRSFSPAVVLELGRQGVFGMTVPVEHGGLALRAADWLRVFEQLAAIDLSLSQLAGVATLAIRPIAAFGTPALKAELLADLATGRALASYAQTEPGAGSDTAKLATTARRGADGRWVVDGEKTYIGNAGWASVFTVFAQTDDGLGAFVVRAGAPGLRVGPELMTMGLRGVVQNSVRLAQVAVPDADRLPADGLTIGTDAMTITRLQLAASALGGVERAIQWMDRFAARREVATGRLLDHPRIGGWIADALALAHLLAALVRDTAARLDRGERVSMDLLAALKVIGSEGLGEVADRLVQCLGSRGYDEASGAAQLYRDARVLRIFEGPTEVLTAFLGARAARADRGLPAELDPPSASRLAAALARLPAGDPHGRQGEAGNLALAALLLATAGRLPPSPIGTYARAWADARFAEAEARALRGAPPRPASDDLRAAARDLAAAIGDGDPSAAGEQWAADPLTLRAAEPAPTAPADAKRGWLW